MDDANVPVRQGFPLAVAGILTYPYPQSLLSLPYLGFLDRHHPTYLATRKLLLSAKNPYYAEGGKFRGIGYVIRQAELLSMVESTYWTEDLT